MLADDDDPLLGRVLNDRYRVVRRLGEGGMGAVYEAHHELIDKRVVIKVLHEDMAKDAEIVERFRREARAATAIGNEHIVDVTDMGELADGSPFLVMEFLEGCALADVVEEDGPLTVARAVAIVAQICDALGAAHAKGIVHRDLKPDNVFLIRRKGADFVKVLDFGISKMKEIPGLDGSLTKTGVAMGTPSYMAPEQAQGLRTVDQRADIYAVGVILFELLAGTLPFDAPTYPALLLKVMTESAPVLTQLRADVPPGLAALVLRMLEKQPEGRPTTMEEVAEALAPFRAVDLAPTMLEPPRPDPAKPADAGRGAVASLPTAFDDARRQETEPQGAHDPAARAVAPTLAAEATPPRIEATEATAARADDTVALPPSPSRSPWPMAVAVVAVVGVAGVAFATLGRDPAPDPVPPAPDPVEAPAEVRLQIRVSPADATIRLDGVELPNPVDAARLRSLDPVPLVVAREGYVTVERAVVLDRDQNLDLTLAPASAPTPVEPPAPEDPPAEVEAPEPTPGRGARRRRPAETPPADTGATDPPAEEPPGDDIYRGRRGGLRDEF